VIVTKDQAPPTGGMGGAIHKWERGLDPWHRDSFEGLGAEVQDQAPNQEGERKSGWYAVDYCGNTIGFVTDGSMYGGDYVLDLAEIETAIGNIAADIFESTDKETHFPVSIESDSYAIAVDFVDIRLWDSEIDTRKVLSADGEDEIYEPFEDCLRRRMREELALLAKIKV